MKNGIEVPYCGLCGERCYIEKHLKSEMHFKRLWVIIEEAQKLERSTGRHIMDNDIWYQDYEILSGQKKVRFNHIDLSVYVCTGLPTTRAPCLLSPQSLPIIQPPIVDNGYLASPWAPAALPSQPSAASAPSPWQAAQPVPPAALPATTALEPRVQPQSTYVHQPASHSAQAKAPPPPPRIEERAAGHAAATVPSQATGLGWVQEAPQPTTSEPQQLGQQLQHRQHPARLK